MTKLEKIELLSKMPLFSNCNNEILDEISTQLYIRQYKKGDWASTPEKSIHKITLIANEGRMKIFTTNSNSDEFIVYCLMFGDLFNVVTLFDEKKDNLYAIQL